VHAMAQQPTSLSVVSVEMDQQALGGAYEEVPMSQCICPDMRVLAHTQNSLIRSLTHACMHACVCTFTPIHTATSSAGHHWRWGSRVGCCP
jgi:hypothetical protein